MRKAVAGIFLLVGIAGCCLVVVFFLAPEVLPAQVRTLLKAPPGPIGELVEAVQRASTPAPESVEEIIRTVVDQLEPFDDAAVEGMLLAPAPAIEPDDGAETPPLAALTLPVVDGEAVIAPHAPAVEVDLAPRSVETPSPAPPVQVPVGAAAQPDVPPASGCPCPTPMPTAQIVPAAAPVILAAAQPAVTPLLAGPQQVESAPIQAPPAASPTSPVAVSVPPAGPEPEQVTEAPLPTLPLQAPVAAQGHPADPPLPAPPAAQPVPPAARPLAPQDLSPTPPLRGVMGYRLPMVSRQHVPDQVVSGVLVRAHETYVILRPGYWELLQADGGIVVPARQAPAPEVAAPPQGRRWWKPNTWFRKGGDE